MTEFNYTNEKGFENLIIINYDKKALKPLIGLFNLIILINFFILQFGNITHFNYYFQLILNEFICIYLWIEIRAIKVKYHINQIKIILFSDLLFSIIIFIYKLKTVSSKFIGINLDFIMLIIIFLSDTFFIIIFLICCFNISKYLN